jgi:hypothetical protein
MKRLITLLALLLLPVWAQGAYAQVSIIFFDSNPSPNVLAQFGAGGTGTVFADGNSACPWCEVGYPFNTPGASLNPSLGITYDDLGGAINCDPFGEAFCSMSDDQITALRDITFPKNGQESFIVTVPAAESGVSGAVVSPEGEMPFSLGGARGQLTLDFVFSQLGGGLYVISQGTFSNAITAPEPGPLGLMAAGLAGLAFMGRRRRSHARLLASG